MDESNGHPKSKDSPTTTTSVHVTALDGLVSVNSLFTIAVFIGLSFTPGQSSLEDKASCEAGVDMVKRLMVYEVASFSFFLFSSLVAQGLKLAINVLNSKDRHEALKCNINHKFLNFGLIASAFGSVMACLFLVLSMVNVIQIRLGIFSCGSKYAVPSAVTLVVLVTSGISIYISAAVYAVYQVYKPKSK